jgi:hypothetical protein
MGTLALYALLAIGVIAGLAGLHYGIDKRGFDRGVSQTTTKWQAQAAQDKAEYDKKKSELEEKALQKERAWSELLAGIDSRHQKEIRDAETRRRNDIAAARSGSIKLRDPGATECRPAGGGAGSAVAAAPGVGDAKERGELPREAPSFLSARATEFLIDLANEADEVVAQLGQCQAVVEADRKVHAVTPR